MKRIIAVLLAMVMVLSMVGCNSATNVDGTHEHTTSESTEAGATDDTVSGSDVENSTGETEKVEGTIEGNGTEENTTEEANNSMESDENSTAADENNSAESDENNSTGDNGTTEGNGTNNPTINEPTTNAPVVKSTEAPTEAPTVKPTEAPTQASTQKPTEEPTQAPTEEPTEAPTEVPIEAPTEAPTVTPNSGRSDLSLDVQSASSVTLTNIKISLLQNDAVIMTQTIDSLRPSRGKTLHFNGCLSAESEHTIVIEGCMVSPTLPGPGTFVKSFTFTAAENGRVLSMSIWVLPENETRLILQGRHNGAGTSIQDQIVRVSASDGTVVCETQDSATLELFDLIIGETYEIFLVEDNVKAYWTYEGECWNNLIIGLDVPVAYLWLELIDGDNKAKSALVLFNDGIYEYGSSMNEEGWVKMGLDAGTTITITGYNNCNNEARPFELSLISGDGYIEGNKITVNGGSVVVQMRIINQ